MDTGLPFWGLSGGMRYMAVVKTFFLLMAALVLQSCSIAVGNKFAGFESVSEAQATIYVLRTEGGAAFRAIDSSTTGSYPEIMVNGQPIGLLKRGGYLMTNVAPGKVTVATIPGFNWSLGKQSVDLDAKGGERYFIQLNTAFSPIVPAGKPLYTRVVGVSFLQIGEARASEILKELSLP